MSAVLVTGGSGFVASYCILQLLAEGHTVRTTVRNLKRESDVRSMLKTGGAGDCDRLSFFAADLESDAGWSEATAGITEFARLPENARRYLARMEELAGVPIDLVSTGAERAETIVLRHPFD